MKVSGFRSPVAFVRSVNESSKTRKARAQSLLHSPANPAAELHGHGGVMPHILVADDDPSYLMILERLCASCGATVVTASNAADARTALASHDFDLLLLDLQLERQEGLGLIAEVEGRPELARKAVVVTGFSMMAPAFTQLPVVDKGRLTDLSDYLRSVLSC